MSSALYSHQNSAAYESLTLGTPASNFPDAAAPLTSIALAGHLAQFAGQGRKIEWDVEKMASTNNAEVNQYVKREYRPGWEV